MPVRCDNCVLRQREAFSSMSPDEVAFMMKFKSGELTVGPGTVLLMEGSNSPQLYTALSGMGLRFKLLSNGRRQVVNLVFPGDFIGLQAGVMGEMTHSVEATTRMTLCVFNRADIWTLFKTQPSRAFDLTWLSAVEEHFLGEALATMGQRDALEKVAWCFFRVFERMRMLNLTDGRSCPLPYRQQDLADALGLSLVHTNKTIQKLRRSQVAGWSEGRLTVDDLDRLAEIALIEDRKLPQRPLF